MPWIYTLLKIGFTRNVIDFHWHDPPPWSRWQDCSCPCQSQVDEKDKNEPFILSNGFIRGRGAFTVTIQTDPVIICKRPVYSHHQQIAIGLPMYFSGQCMGHGLHLMFYLQMWNRNEQSDRPVRPEYTTWNNIQKSHIFLEFLSSETIHPCTPVYCRLHYFERVNAYRNCQITFLSEIAKPLQELKIINHMSLFRWIWNYSDSASLCKNTWWNLLSPKLGRNSPSRFE